MSISLVNDVGSIIIIGDEPRRSFPQPAQILAQAQTERLKALQKSEEVFTRKADGYRTAGDSKRVKTQLRLRAEQNRLTFSAEIERLTRSLPRAVL